MTTDKLSTENVAQTREFLASVGKDDLADRFGEELEDRAEAAERVVRMKELAARAEEAGLADDPAVAALRERAEALQSDVGLEPEPSAPARLAADHGLVEEAVAELPEGVREDLEEDLAAVEQLETSRSDLAKRELRHRRDKLSATLADAGVEAAHLVAEDAPEPTAELSAALAAADEVADDGSERVRAARLRDRLDDVSDDLADAESTLLEVTLEDRKADLEEQLADLEE